METQCDIGGSSLFLREGDITTMEVEAIVNAANTRLAGGGGVDGAIHRAGGPAIMDECNRIRADQGGCPTGRAVLTTGGRLYANHVIHTVGPRWKGGNQNEDGLLKSCYRESLSLAATHGIQSIAFPSVSTGVYGYPVELASGVALRAVIDFMNERPAVFERVGFVLFDGSTYRAYASTLDDFLQTNR